MPLVELFCCVLSANNQAKTFLRHENQCVWQSEGKRKERYTKASITESLVSDVPSFTSFYYNLSPLRLDPCLPGHNKRGTLVFAPGNSFIWSASMGSGLTVIIWVCTGCPAVGWACMEGVETKKKYCVVQLGCWRVWPGLSSVLLPHMPLLFEQILRVWDLCMHWFEAKLLCSL